MKGLDLLMDLGKVSKTEHKVNNEHVPSTIQPDTLFTFTTEFKWLISMLKIKWFPQGPVDIKKSLEVKCYIK